MPSRHRRATTVGALATLIALAPVPAAHAQDEAITEGISPGLVYSFQDEAGISKRIHDTTNSWFVDEVVDAPGLLDQAFTRTYREQQVVQAHGNTSGDGAFREARQTFHVVARSAASAAPILDGASFGAAQVWRFEVTDPSGLHPQDARVQAVVSGRLWVKGQLTVFGAGSASAEARLAIREERSGFPHFRPVLSESLASWSIDHSYDIGVSASIDVVPGFPFVGGGIGVAASRGFANERIRLEDEPVEFSFACELRVGHVYELVVSFAGHAENRGLPNNFSAVVFANTFDLDDIGQDGGTDVFRNETDPTFVTDAVAFFGLELPDLQFGKSVKGKERWKFPKLGDVFDGKEITMGNDFRIEPLGKIDSPAEALAVIGDTVGLAKVSGSGEPEVVCQPLIGASRGGVWLGDLAVSLEGP